MLWHLNLQSEMIRSTTTERVRSCEELLCSVTVFSFRYSNHVNVKISIVIFKLAYIVPSFSFSKYLKPIFITIYYYILIFLNVFFKKN